jgi:hypothetical protein
MLGVSRGVSVVIAASRTDPALCVLVNEGKKMGYGFDEPYELLTPMP